MAASNGRTARIDEAQLEQAAKLTISDHSNNGIWIAVSEADDASAVIRDHKESSAISTPAQERSLFHNGHPLAPRRQLSATDLRLSESGSEPPSSTHDTSIAAPYEQPVAPIEHDQEKRFLQSQISQACKTDSSVLTGKYLNLKEGKLSRRASSELLDEKDGGPGASYSRNFDPNAPDFQRLNISGYDDLHIAKELAACDDLVRCAREVADALAIRQKYMRLADQQFPSVVDRFIESYRKREKAPKPLEKATVGRMTIQEHFLSMLRRVSIQDHPIHPPVRTSRPYDIEIPADSGHVFRLKKGAFEVYGTDEAMQRGDAPLFQGISRDEWWADYHTMWLMMLDGPLKSFCFRKLSFLESKFLLHVNLNENRETAAQKMVPHRDFYNIRKVDTHIHASSCMNQKHLLRFIKRQMRLNADEKVVIDKGTGQPMTLSEVFQSMNLSTYDLNVDRLDVHADRNTFHRFDKFNAKYNPIGQSLLREIFIKTDNYVNGRYFADILKEVMQDLEESKYQNAELRLSIYGRSIHEWDRLAKWAIDHEVWSPNNVWMIQIPRLYDVYKENKLVKSFEDVIRNIFQPLFEATTNPGQHPHLHRFLQHVGAFDSVDDESKIEHIQFTANSPYPEAWTMEENPPYAYYLFFMYSNMVALNNLRKARGMNTFVLRPHCGEAGPVNHMIVGFMLGESISHGLMLRKVPVLQYLYYLSQIGIAMSPLSNNSLFLDYNRNPLRDYFLRGLNVSLSTDDPLQFHFTKEPLMEEYSIAAQIWKLSGTDLCELAKNSVLQSGFSDTVKQHWLGPNYKDEGVAGNDISRSNVPDIRIAYRYETLLDELTNIFEVVTGEEEA